jgi:hypothetical protein
MDTTFTIDITINPKMEWIRRKVFDNKEERDR